MTAAKHIAFLFNLPQDVNILRPIAYLAAREFDAAILFLLSANFLRRDRERTWQREIAEIGADVGASIHIYATPLDAFAVLQGKSGVILAGSESSLPDHAATHDVFLVAPPSFLKVTLQHGYECVGLMQSRQHDVAHGRNVTFAADVVCGWCPPATLTSLRPSERPKLYVTGPSTILQIAASGPAAAAWTRPGGLVCENLHSARLRASGNFAPSFLDVFFSFCQRLRQDGLGVNLRPHPGGQFVLRQNIALPENVVVNNLPIYKVGLGAFDYGISAPSTVLIDLMLADIPVAVWRDEGGVIDVSNYRGLTEISGLDDWLVFARRATESAEAAKERQRRFMTRLELVTDRAEVYRRFARLLGTSADGVVLRTAPPTEWAAGFDGPLARAAAPVHQAEWRPVIRTNGGGPSEDRSGAGRSAGQAVRPVRRDAERVLLLTDVVSATQTINFTRPLAAAIASGAVALKMVEDKQIRRDPAGQAAALWAACSPTVLILSRYSGGGYAAFVARARAAGIPVIYHIDDDLLSVPPTVGAAKFAYYNAPTRLANLRAAIAASDLVYASTPPLAARMRAYGLGPEVVAGAIGCAIEPARFRAPSPSPRKVIGYAATSGHGRDLDLVLGDLVWLLDTHADLGFELFGSLRMPEALVRFGDRALKREPIDDYDGFVATLGELGWWFGIAPLEDNAFNTCKTETKWLEYSAAGIPTLASDVAVYRRCCQGGAGILVADGAWGAEMDRMLREPSLRSEVIGAAQQSVTARYSLSRLQAQLADIFRQGAEIARRRSQAFVVPEAGVPTASPPGAGATVRKAPPPAGPRPGEYERWVREFDTLDERDRSAIGEAVAALSAPPLISVVIIGEGGVPMGSRTATSLEAQLYPHWEALMPAGATPIAGFNPRLRQVPGARTLADLVGAARGRYIAFVEIDDVLAEHALALMALEADRHPDAELLYSDEDSIAADGERQSPYFKGDWNPDLLLGQDYPCRLGLVAAAVARRAAPGLPPEAPAVHALMLDAFGGRAAPAVRHVPFVLYHRAGGRAERLAPPGAVAEAARRTLAAGTAGALPSVATLDDGRRRVAWPLPAAAPKVSVVIPTRDRADLLETCVEGLRRGTDYPDLEILVVDNGSREDATRRYFHSLSADRRVRILDYPGAFNFSAINNFGVAAASGDIVALLNNDIEVIHADWLREMVAQALRPDVGAVGAMLLYPDDTVQHAGIVLGVGTASHILKGQPADGPGYCGRLTLAQDVAAVTAACLVLRREVWDRAGGLDETFVVAYNDVDLCLRIREAGYRVVWTPFARLYHHESASRGSDKEAEKRVRLDEEKRRLRARWSRWIEHDSFFSPNLSLTSLDCRPAFPPRVERMWKRLKNCAAE